MVVRRLRQMQRQQSRINAFEFWREIISNTRACDRRGRCYHRTGPKPRSFQAPRLKALQRVDCRCLLVVADDVRLSLVAAVPD